MPSVQSVPIEDIKIDQRHRGTDPAKVTSLAESIRSVGLLNAVTIDEDYNLIAGRHRIEAYIELGWKSIECRVLNLTGLKAELAAIDENLERAELSQLAHVQALARRKEVYEGLFPDSKADAIRARTQHKGNGKVPGGAGSAPPENKAFSQETASKTGQSVRTVQQEIAIGEALDGEAVAAIADVPAIADNKAELAALAKLPPKEQRRVAAKVKACKAPSVRAAVANEPGGGGKQKSDPRPFARLEAELGKCLRSIDALHKSHPADKFHRESLSHVKSALNTIHDWQKATRR